MSQEQLLPEITISAQFIKDLSVENAAPPGRIKIDSAPTIDLSLDINITKLSDDGYFEVMLNINVKANHKQDLLFIVELAYGGIFRLVNVPKEQEKAMLSVHCASMIFPYARKIIADMTQGAGFQPLMMDPIDFARLYYKRLADEENADKTVNN